MSVSIHQLFEEALSLSGEGRLELAERLIESVPADPEILGEQLQIASRRADEMDSGAIRGIEGDDALRQVRESVLKMSEE